MGIIDDVHKKQREAKFSDETTPPPQDPEMLYIGCVDARLDPVKDIGIEQGRALIYRNIGAMVPPRSEKAGDDTITARDSIGAVLELFLDLMEPPPPGRTFKMKHIVVSGHTCCGGINCTCRKPEELPAGGFLKRYISAFSSAVAEIFGASRPKSFVSDEQMRELEKESVRRSLHNLRSYPIVREAEEKGLVELHGWIIDTATKRISEMNKETKEFVAMDERSYRGKHSKKIDGRDFASPHNRG